MPAKYDPTRLQQIAGRYQGYGENRVDPGNFSRATNQSVPQSNPIGSVFNSIRSGVQATPGIVGGFLHKALVEEPTVWAKYVGGNLNTFAHTPINVIKNYQQYQKDHNFNKYLSAQLGTAGEGINAYRGSVGIVPTKELVQKGLPVGLTAASIAVPFAKSASLAKTAAVAPDSLSLGQKAINMGTKFGSDIVTGNGNFAARFSNPIANNAAKAVSGLTYNALVTRPTVESLAQAPQNINDIAHGKNVADNAINLAGIGAPALLTGGQKLAKVASKFIGKNIFDTSGMFDIVKVKGGKTVNQALAALKSEANSTKDVKILRQAKQTENKLRQLQDLALQEAGGNHKLAAQNLSRYQSSMNQFENMDLDKALKEMTKHFQARLAAQKLAKTGLIKDEVLKKGNLTVARLTPADRSVIANTIKQADDPVAAIKALRKDKTIKNSNLYGQLLDIANSGEDGKIMAQRVKEITAAKPLLINGKAQEFGNGYFAVINKEAGKLQSDVSKTANLVTGQEARFGKVGEMLRKAGISPEEVTAEDNRVVFNKFKNEFMKRIDGVGGKTGDSIYKSLNELADSSLGVTDIRQLSKRAIAGKLNISTDEAGKILRDAKDSYKVLSVAERGLAGKLMDFNLRVNPLAAPYSRVQSVARYEKNPFFRLQENIETRFGVSAMGGKQAVPLTKQYDSTITKLNQKGIFTSGYGAEGADSFSGSFSGVKAKLSRDQQANIAATIEKFAGGPDKVDNWLRNPKNADLLNDFKTIVQYPDKGFTSSNLAKMMNLVAFPSRYNLKVTQFAVKQFMKQPAPVQISIIRGLKDFNDFTKTPEGIKWQADNKEALGLLSYFTPIQPISSVYDTITGKNKSLGELGMVGGLPFGVLTRILQGQGILRDRVPYVDPKTGKVYSDRIPEDLKARAESLLGSIVDTLYTYPGRMAGLETSKKQLTQGIVDNATFGQLKDGKYSETDRSGDITPEQQRQINVLRAGSQSGTQPSTPSKLKTIPIAPDFNVTKGINFYKPPKAKKGKKAKPIAKPIASLL